MSDTPKSNLRISGLIMILLSLCAVMSLLFFALKDKKEKIIFENKMVEILNQDHPIVPKEEYNALVQVKDCLVQANSSNRHVTRGWEGSRQEVWVPCQSQGATQLMLAHRADLVPDFGQKTVPMEQAFKNFYEHE